MVIGHSIPKTTEAELANRGIESRAIPECDVLAALEGTIDGTPVQRGLQLSPDDLGKVRHLLSDYSAVAVPQDLVLGPPWSHEKVFLALVERGEKYKDPWKKNICVHLYTRRPGCAVLYGPKVGSVKRGPLHLNPRRVTSWDEGVFQQIKPFIKYAQTDNKGPGRERSNFDWYTIKDWDGFANALGL
jgi:hypothetical protein